MVQKFSLKKLWIKYIVIFDTGEITMSWESQILKIDIKGDLKEALQGIDEVLEGLKELLRSKEDVEQLKGMLISEMLSLEEARKKVYYLSISEGI